MKHWLLGPVLAASFGMAAAGAALSMNEVDLAAGTDMAACKAAGKRAIAKVGLADAGASAASVFGEGADGLIAAVYCLPDKGIAMIGIAGNTSEATRPVLAALIGAMQAD